MISTKYDDRIPDRSITVRRPLMVVVSVALAVGGLIVVAVVTVAIARPGHVVKSGDYGGIIAYSLVSTFVSTIIGLISWTSSIRLGRDAVVVRNMLIVHRIPWDCVSEIRLGDGLEIVLSSQKIIGSIQFGQSLLGSITGYPSYRRSVDRMKTARARFASGSRRSTTESEVGSSSHFQIPYRQIICWFFFYFVPPMAALIFK